MGYQGVSIFPNIFFVASLCSFICLQAVYQLSGAVCKATWNGYRIHFSPSFHALLIDFLSIMHLSIACPTTPLTGLGGAIARRLQQICPSIRPQHRGL